MTSKRQDIIDAANSAFYREGFAEIGVDRIVSDAGVALGTLYRQFGTRSAVVVAVMDERHRQFMAELEQDSGAHTRSGAVLFLFDRLEEWSKREGGNGCFFLRAASDYPNDTRIREAALRHKREYFRLINRLLISAGWQPPQAAELAQSIFLLLEGAVAAAFTLGDATSVSKAKELAAVLLSPDDRT